MENIKSEQERTYQDTFIDLKLFKVFIQEDTSFTNTKKKNKNTNSYKEIVKNAIKNYEIFNDLPAGTATIKQVEESPQGIDGFVNWRQLGRNSSEDVQREVKQIILDDEISDLVYSYRDLLDLDRKAIED